MFYELDDSEKGIDNFCVVVNLGVDSPDYKLNRKEKSGQIIRDNFTAEVLRKRRFIFRKYRKDLILFIERLYKAKPDFDFELFIRNLETLKFKVQKGRIKGEDDATLGIYSVFDNTITLVKGEEKACIFHELFHTASSYYEESTDISFSGFSQRSIFRCGLGHGLNEGYTQLLTERYFGDLNILNTYGLESYFAEKIEKIVGREKMEKLYFESDLYELLVACMEYVSEGKFIKFIQDLDWLFYNPIESQDLYREERIKKIHSASEFILLLKVKKEIADYNNGNISKDQLGRKFEEHYRSIHKSRYLVNEEFYCFGFDKIGMYNKLLEYTKDFEQVYVKK